MVFCHDENDATMNELLLFKVFFDMPCYAMVIFMKVRSVT